ncbi:hypothetical protein A8709_22485 [Paenibacillus pectinilyticus]|uniref:Lipoprotein n=1 Tax=Paenibacillus pectinilyticus TaxID=512399 RepID=A0A1C0ZRC8_9BACL|nr:hypothetical protein [Paenibacillus pectinilyticus]OCT10614.1 hypothetical protein A8709_22485 [Paenibacillus pectinilyticus]
MKAKWLLVLMLGMVLTLTACGGPKPDVSVFIMGPNGFPSEAAEKLETSLKLKVGDTPTVKLNTSPIFSMEKMIVELAAGGNGIFILADEQFKGLSNQAGFVSLDDTINPADYPDGVIEIKEEGKEAQKHLYGIPLEGNKWMKEQGYEGKGLVAFVPLNAPKMDEALKVLKIIAQK